MSSIIRPIYENIDSNEPFARDIYDRKKLAEDVTEILKKINSEFVVSIDADWGQGKTTFIKMWEEYLKKQEDINFIPIYYDAFKNDFTDDVFLSIAALIYSNLDTKTKNKKKNSEQRDNLKRTICEVAKDSVALGAKAVVNLATAGTCGELAENATKKIFTALDVEKKFEAHLKIEKDINDYKDCLQEILETSGKDSKIVFFIDELDRCRPNFAIEVIEKIKHFFNIPRVIFVLAVNKTQLNQVFKKAYGMDDNHTEAYLNKFIHLNYKLPSIISASQRSLPYSPGHIETQSVLVIRFQEILKDLNTQDVNLQEIFGSDIIQFCDLIKSMSINPRNLERVLFHFRCIIKEDDFKPFSNEKNYYFSLLLLLLLKAYMPDKPTLFINKEALDRETKFSCLFITNCNYKELWKIISRYDF